MSQGVPSKDLFERISRPTVEENQAAVKLSGQLQPLSSIMWQSMGLLPLLFQFLATSIQRSNGFVNLLPQRSTKQHEAGPQLSFPATVSMAHPRFSLMPSDDRPSPSKSDYSVALLPSPSFYSSSLPFRSARLHGRCVRQSHGLSLSRSFLPYLHSDNPLLLRLRSYISSNRWFSSLVENLASVDFGDNHPFQLDIIPPEAYLPCISSGLNRRSLQWCPCRSGSPGER